MSLTKGLSVLWIAIVWILGIAGSAAAAQPEPWQIGFQPAASPVMDAMRGFNDFLLVVVGAILIFVLALLLFVIARFNAKRNPVPAKTTHNTVLEVVWTVVPMIILIVVAVPSFKLLYYMDKTPDAELTLKVIGNQWYWTYEYPDYDDLTFDAVMLADEGLEEGQLRLLETDNRVVLPVDATIRVLVTAADVIHSWSVPAFGMKIDAVPGRLNETWLRIEREGVYYGQCSELCGVYHAFMPITVEAVSKRAFAGWIEEAQEEFAQKEAPAPSEVAVAQASRRE